MHRFSTRLWRGAQAVALAAACVACGNDPFSNPADVAGGPVDATADSEVGSVDAAPQLEVQTCGPAGTAACDPADSTHKLICGATGQWQDNGYCDVGKSQVCFAGGCQDACEVSAQHGKNNVGCAFWAADLDNALVPGGTQSYYDADNAQFALVVANASDKLLASVTIANHLGKQELDTNGKPLDYAPLKPGELRVFNLPPRNISGTTKEPLAWRVTSTAPVAAYQFNPLENVNAFSNDASLLLPDEALGKYYIVLSREQSFSILRGFLTVVGTKPGVKTKVTIIFGPKIRKTLPGTVKKVSADGTIAETPIKSYPSKAVVTLELEAHEVLNIETDAVGADLTGTVVQASEQVAVFAGSEAANAPNTNHCNVDKCSDSQIAEGDWCGVCAWNGKTTCNNNEHCQQFITCCADHLEMQQFPVKTWGSHYVAVKLKPRATEADSWRILAAKDGTKVTLTPPQMHPQTGKAIEVPVLNAGQWFEFEAGQGVGPNFTKTKGGVFEIAAKDSQGKPAPIAVGHFMQSQDAPGPGAQQGDAGTGDPAYLLAVPVEQWRSDYLFLTPHQYNSNWISIAAPVQKACSAESNRAGQACASDATCAPGSCVDQVTVLFDGVAIPDAAWQPVSDDYKFTWQFAPSGVHRVATAAVKTAEGDATKPKVAVDVYGFDQYVSYGYPAGLDLRDAQLFEEP
ncbi:MAG: IgGFc-binding protein [Deltaproteobacteria bacterium]|nr:IgGFc-binding protein [Deltaproteobacteria bacterium]